MFVNLDSSVRKTSECPLSVFFVSCIIYCGVGVFEQLSYMMCDVMTCCLLDNVPMLCTNLGATQHEITFQRTINIRICMQQRMEPAVKVK